LKGAVRNFNETTRKKQKSGTNSHQRVYMKAAMQIAANHSAGTAGKTELQHQLEEKNVMPHRIKSL
jgi:hypothetical protein